MNSILYIRNKPVFIKVNAQKTRANAFPIPYQAAREINAICLKDVEKPGYKPLNH
jgi:hypothetical protein